MPLLYSGGRTPSGESIGHDRSGNVTSNTLAARSVSGPWHQA